MSLTRIGPKYQVTIPKEAREAAGLEVGDLVEATPTGDGVLLRPKVLVDKHPKIEVRLREAEADIRAQRVYGPFRTSGELVRSLRQGRPARRTKGKPRKTR